MGSQPNTEYDEMTYRTPDRGEDHLPKDLPIGWIADQVDEPESWEVEFIDSGACLRYRRRVDREEYGAAPPGYPGVGITAGRDYWAIIGDSDRVLWDEWFDPDDDPADVVASVEDAIEAVDADLERLRLARILDGAVPSHIVANLIERFGTAQRVAEVEDDTPLIESVDGVGPSYRKAIQQKFMLYHMRQSDDVEAEINVE